MTVIALWVPLCAFSVVDPVSHFLVLIIRCLQGSLVFGTTSPSDPVPEGCILLHKLTLLNMLAGYLSGYSLPLGRRNRPELDK